jgi:hypothetical protein
MGPGITVLVLLVALAGSFAHEAQGRSDLELPEAYGRVPDNIYAIRDPHIFTHNVGLLTLQITNVGLIGNPFIDDLSAGWRGGEYLFFSGLWIGALGSDSEAHVSTAAPVELRPDLDARWTLYESFEGTKDGFRLGPQGPAAADDDGDGLIDEDFQNGLDDDGDGLVDEDFAAIGQQMLSCVYRDDTPEAISQVTDHFPLNLLVRQRSFQWSTALINEFVGFDFEIVNTGDQRLKDLYIGFFSDSDAGPKTAERYWTDDLVGWAHIDTTVVDPNIEGPCGKIDVEMDVAYMWDAPDNGTSVVGGDVDGIFGSLFLGHTTDDTGIKAPQNVAMTTVAWFSASGQNSDPQNDDERYTLLASGTKPNRAAAKPDDYRYIIAAGPFAQLNPGESLTFQTAYVIGQRGSITPAGILEDRGAFDVNAVSAQRVFNGKFVDADDNPDTGVNGKERCLQVLEVGASVVWDDPCDTLNTTQNFRSTPPCDVPGGHYVDDDCSPCTGVNGEEALINWVGTTAPPPPAMNTDPDLRLNPAFSAFSPAGDRKVTLFWDNSSELRRDPITGDDIFEGYRIWRVDNWQRPEGSIGPSQDEWMKLAEFRRNPDDANEQGARSLLKPFPEGPVIRTVQPIEFTDENPPRPVYPIGRYQYEDSLGIINGKLYFYSITAFGIVTSRNPVTQRDEKIELSGLPASVEAEAVVPRWDSVEGCDRVTVVPNPYRGGADWDLVPSERDPTGTKIAFRNLPNDVSTVRIYTLAGDLVETVVWDGRIESGGDGTFFWDMITRNGQNVVSGVYLYSVEYSGGTCRGRFVIIR